MSLAALIFCLPRRRFMQRDDQYLFDILDAAKLAASYVSGMSRQDFLQNIQCQDAVVRRLEIIGEASRRVSEQTRTVLTHIPWRALVGMRKLMIHEYDD